MSLVKGKRQPLRKVPVAKKAEKRSRSGNSSDEPAKKQRGTSKEQEKEQAPESGDDDDEDEGEDGQEEEQLKDLNTQEYTFEFNDMKDEYSPGIKIILASTLVANPSKAYQLSDEIVKQDTVGTIVACEGEHDVFAYATIMPCKLLKDNEWLKTLQQYFDSKLSDIPANTRKVFECLKDDKKNSEVGFLIHGRYSNAPLELISQVHNNLWLDYEWVMNQKKSGGKEGNDDIDWDMVQMFHKLKYLIVVTSATSEAEFSATENVRGRSDIFFNNFEDECYFGHANAAFFVKFGGGSYFKPSSSVVMIISIENFKSCVDDIMKLVG